MLSRSTPYSFLTTPFILSIAFALSVEFDFTTMAFEKPPSLNRSVTKFDYCTNSIISYAVFTSNTACVVQKSLYQKVNLPDTDLL